MKTSMDETVKYASQVRQLAQLSGTSAEESSRFIQVLDDYKISAEEAMVATRALTKEGLTPSIDTLAKLSDEYLSLTSAQQKNEFVLKNLGRGGMQWVEVLSKGSKAIREQGDAIDKSLILTDKAVNAAREYEMALDAWNDSVMALKISIGNQLLPELTKLLQHNRIHTRALEIMKEQGLSTYHAMSTVGYAAAYKLATGEIQATDAANDLTDASNQLGQSISGIADPIQTAKDALKDYEDALDSASQANLDFESMSRSIADSQKDYDKSHADLSKQFMDAWGKGDNEGMAQAQADIDELQATWHEAANNMIYDMVLVGVSAGGLLDSEQKALDEYAVKAGIKTQADIDEANRRREVADSTIAGILQSEDVLAEQRAIDAETLRLQDATTAAAVMTSAAQEAQAMANVTLSIDSATRSLMAMAAAAGATAGAVSGIKMPSALPTGISKVAADPRRGRGTKYALGGEFMIPMGYGYEGFGLGGIATASGGETVTVTPKGESKSGAVYNIVINNPKREAAEDSIKSALRNLVYTGSAT
jgi:hypothetical protein